MAEAFRVEEVSNFTTTSYTENLPPTCTSHSLVTTTTRAHRHWAFSNGNSEKEAQVHPRTYEIMSGALSHYTCCWTLKKWLLIESKFSMSFLRTSSISSTYRSNPLTILFLQGVYKTTLGSEKGSYHPRRRRSCQKCWFYFLVPYKGPYG